MKSVLWFGFNFKGQQKELLKKEFEKLRCVFADSFPKEVFYDYDCVIVNLSTFQSSYGLDYQFIQRSDEFLQLLVAGKLLIVLTSGPNLDNRNYVWLPYTLKFGTGLGTTLLPKSDSKYFSYFSNLLRNFSFEWKAYLRPTSGIQIDVLANNNGNQPIAFVAEFPSLIDGKLVCLPTPNESTDERILAFNVELLKSVLQISKLKGSPSTQSITPIPDWIEKIKFSEEEEAKAKLIEAKTVIEEAHLAKSILFERGKSLSKPVQFIFQKIGFAADLTEQLGNQDVLLKLDNWQGLVEVKSVEGKSIERNVAGQLIAHLLEYPEEKESTKLILVINQDPQKLPAERRKPEEIITDKGLATLKAADVCIVFSTQLFEIYESLQEKGSEQFKKKIQEKIKTTNGFLSY